MSRVNRSKSEIIDLLKNPGVIAIIRTGKLTDVVPMLEALVQGGIVAIEITLTAANALDAIREGREKLGDRCLVGVGTVLDSKICGLAIEAGAEFIVSPVCRTELVNVAHGAGRPIMLGAYTPTEAQTAYEAGADFIKIFPSDTLGPLYIKALRAPLPHLRLVPTGGVRLDNVGEFLEAGCAAVGVGSSLVSADILRTANWPELSRRAEQFVKAAQTVHRAKKSSG